MLSTSQLGLRTTLCPCPGQTRLALPRKPFQRTKLVFTGTHCLSISFQAVHTSLGPGPATVAVMAKPGVTLICLSAVCEDNLWDLCQLYIMQPCRSESTGRFRWQPDEDLYFRQWWKRPAKRYAGQPSITRWFSPRSPSSSATCWHPS